MVISYIEFAFSMLSQRPLMISYKGSALSHCPMMLF